VLDIDKGCYHLPAEPEVRAKLRCSDRRDMLASFAASWASIYRRGCIGHDGSRIRPARNGTKVFSISNIFDACRRADPAQTQ